MIPDISQALTWLKKHSQVLEGIQRGIERETLRVNLDGSLATTDHPCDLGSVLTHKWITVDFAETLLEFITPVDKDINRMLTIMLDIHRYTIRKLGNEYMWPLSMPPCYLKQEQKIKLAQFGTSNIGRFKTLYREGLKNRYGALMQIISGVHYNFSFPISFWKAKYNNIDKDAISAGYFHLIRNYYRFGWIIPYLFGASPIICSSLIQGKSSKLPFKRIESGVYYLPYATSLRLSDFGYNCKLQNNLGITFNKLHEYVASLKQAIKTPSKKYEKIGLEKAGKRLQINSNILQTENELYAFIRPKRVTFNGEKSSDALLRDGVEYIEIRSLDINPFSPIGINKQQILFLDLFMVWCILVEAPEISINELMYIRTNWNKVILEGRRPGLVLNFGFKTKRYLLLKKVGKDLFRDFTYMARMFDSVYGGETYQLVCNELVKYFDNPELTFSAQILQSIINNGIISTGCSLAAEYRKKLLSDSLSILSEEDFAIERDASIMRQRKIEATDIEPFIVFLSRHNL